MNIEKDPQSNLFEEWDNSWDVGVFYIEDDENRKDQLINWVHTMFLDKYSKVSMYAKRNVMPSITSSWSDMPSGNGISSKTEDAALKIVMAQKWLDEFHKGLSILPSLHQKIITKKYLERSTDDGSFPLDVAVYNQLGISRTSYYRWKKEALYDLATYLYESKLKGVEVQNAKLSTQIP